LSFPYQSSLKSSIPSIIALLHPNYVAERWHIFLIYTGYTLLALFLNLFAIRLLPKIDKVAFFWSVGGVVLISITLLACASPNYESGKFVFTQFINTTSWPDSVAWLLRLLQLSFGFTAFDACAHMVEEIERPAHYTPRAYWTS
jgi:amino acid transporter